MRWTQHYLGSIPIQKAKPKPNNTEISDKTRSKDDLQNNQTEFFINPKNAHAVLDQRQIKELIVMNSISLNPKSTSKEKNYHERYYWNIVISKIYWLYIKVLIHY